jgi:hypothetical protein
MAKKWAAFPHPDKAYAHDVAAFEAELDADAATTRESER